MGYVLVTALIAAAVQFSSSCFGFALPAASDVVNTFEPQGLYAGHWGADIAVAQGSDVQVMAAGVVRFSGVVVYNTTVSIDHGGGIVTTYSFLDSRAVTRGERVAIGDVVGVSGIHDGREAYHLSLRIDGQYVDPYVLTSCARSPSRGLYLALGGATYAEGRGRDIRWDIRPASLWPSRSGTDRLSPAWS